MLRPHPGSSGLGRASRFTSRGPTSGCALTVLVCSFGSSAATFSRFFSALLRNRPIVLRKRPIAVIIGRRLADFLHLGLRRRSAGRSKCVSCLPEAIGQGGVAGRGTELWQATAMPARPCPGCAAGSAPRARAGFQRSSRHRGCGRRRAGAAPRAGDRRPAARWTGAACSPGNVVIGEAVDQQQRAGQLRGFQQQRAGVVPVGVLAGVPEKPLPPVRVVQPLIGDGGPGHRSVEDIGAAQHSQRGQRTAERPAPDPHPAQVQVSSWAGSNRLKAARGPGGRSGAR